MPIAEDWERLRPRLERLARQRLGDHDLAREAVQEALVSGWERRESLREPAALPGWLAQLTLTACSRRTRRPQALELTEVAPLATPRLEVLAEQGERERRLRAAIASLPSAEAEAITLHYLDGVPSVELAALLGVPDATIRTRLHRARHRLKKELTDMEDTDFKSLYEAARQEYLAQKPVKDAFLRAKAALNTKKELGELDYETVYQGEYLLQRLDDSEARLALLDAYLARPIDPSHVYWARGKRIEALCGLGRHEEAVEAYLARLRSVEKSPERVSITPDGEPWTEGKRHFPTDSVALSALLHAFCDASWEALGRKGEYVALFLRTLTRLPRHDVNRWQRFYAWRWVQLQAQNDATKEKALAEIAALAEEETHPFDAAHWRAQAACQHVKKDVPDQEIGAAAVSALAAAEAALPENDEFRTGKFRTLRNNIGAALAEAQLFDLAEGPMRADCEHGHHNGFSFAFLAQCVWGARKDRKEALSLIRKGQAMEPKTDFWDWLSEKPVFQDVADDPAFRAAGTPPL